MGQKRHIYHYKEKLCKCPQNCHFFGENIQALSVFSENIALGYLKNIIRPPPFGPTYDNSLVMSNFEK